jgi:DNA-binding transcriptional regulator YiaG
MPNIAAVMKEEIARLSRREIRRQIQPLRKASSGYRKHIAALKRQISRLERTSALLSRRAAAAPTSAAPAAEEGGPRRRFVAKGLVSLRRRLGLSAADLGQLIGVSGQSVYNWEAKKATPRRAQLASIAALRGLGKREAIARLKAAAKPAPKAAGKRAASRKRGKAK